MHAARSLFNGNLAVSVINHLKPANFGEWAVEGLGFRVNFGEGVKPKVDVMINTSFEEAESCPTTTYDGLTES